MAHFFTVKVVVKSAVVFRVVRHRSGQLLKFGIGTQVEIFPFHSIQLFEYFFQVIFCVKDRRLVHVVPEAFDALVQKKSVPVSKPFSGVFVKEIRKMHLSGPYGGRQIFPVLFPAEISVLHALFIYRISLFDLDASVDDRYQMYPLFLHFRHKARKIRKGFLVDGEVLVMVHIVDIQINAVQRNARQAVLPGDLADLVRRQIAPAALSETKRPFGRKIAFSGQTAQLRDDLARCFCTCLRRRFCTDQIEVSVKVLKGDDQPVIFCIADIKRDLSRRIYKQSGALSFFRDQQKILRSIKRMLVFRMVRVVRAVADIEPAALVDPADGFAKSVDHRVFGHITAQRPAFGIHLPSGQISCLKRKLLYDSFRVHGVSNAISSDHE